MDYCELVAKALGGEVAPALRDINERLGELFCAQIDRRTYLVGQLASGDWASPGDAATNPEVIVEFADRLIAALNHPKENQDDD